MSDTSNNDKQLQVLKRAYEREKKARMEAEKVTESISSKLYLANIATKKLLSSIVEISAQKKNVEELLKIFLQSICEMTGINVGHVLKRDEVNRFMTSLNIWYIEKDLNISDFISISTSMKFEKKIGLPGRVWDSGKTIWIQNIRTETNFPRNKYLLDNEAIKTGFAVPIKIRGEIEYIFEFFFNSELNKIDILLELVEATSLNIGNIIELRLNQEEKEAYTQELERTHQELAEMQSHVIQSDKLSALGEMAAGIAHEINNPLTIIRGRIGILNRILRNSKELSKNVSDEVKTIETTAIRIEKIVKSMLHLSKTPTNDTFNLLNVEIIVNEVLDLCRAKFQHQNIDFRVNIEEKLQVYCSAIQISQVLLNLLNNAFDALENMIENKWIEIRITDNGKFIKFEVLDSGPGILPKIQEKIFQPFFTTKEIGNGTGLGLSISRKIIENHGGSLIYSMESGNSNFTFNLPKAKADSLPINKIA